MESLRKNGGLMAPAKIRAKMLPLVQKYLKSEYGYVVMSHGSCLPQRLKHTYRVALVMQQRITSKALA